LVANKIYDLTEVFNLTPDDFSMPACSWVNWQDSKMISMHFRIEQSQLGSGMSLLAREKLISSDDVVLLLGKDPQHPLTYHARLNIYFTALEAAPEIA